MIWKSNSARRGSIWTYPSSPKSNRQGGAHRHPRQRDQHRPSRHPVRQLRRHQLAQLQLHLGFHDHMTNTRRTPARGYGRNRRDRELTGWAPQSSAPGHGATSPNRSSHKNLRAGYGCQDVPGDQPPPITSTRAMRAPRLGPRSIQPPRRACRSCNYRRGNTPVEDLPKLRAALAAKTSHRRGVRNVWLAYKDRSAAALQFFETPTCGSATATMPAMQPATLLRPGVTAANTANAQVIPEGAGPVKTTAAFGGTSGR